MPPSQALQLLLSVFLADELLLYPNKKHNNQKKGGSMVLPDLLQRLTGGQTTSHVSI